MSGRTSRRCWRSNFQRGVQHAALLVGALSILGCGASSRQLVSVTISPSSADASNFAGGQVQFVATGTYSRQPLTAQLTSADVSWCVGTSGGHCAGFIRTGATVDANRLAQCDSGFSGPLTILAGEPQIQPSPMPDVGVQLRIFGTAQLICP
jgi:hypothetical protein